jgi:signal transduction histidine kinase
MVVLFLAGGGLLIWRVIQRERAIARLQTEFVSAVSHEFRTPLTSLKHVADLLDEDDELSRERRTALYRVVGRGATRLSSLVESLLDFARMEDGRRPYQLQSHDAATLVPVIVNEFTQHLDSTDVTVDVRAGDGNLSIRADAPALTRAIWNLLDNAVKYSNKPCVVEVSVSRLSSFVAIDVRDRGRGIPKDEQRSVFDKFVRGGDAVTRRVPGTGLGLSIVSHIVRAHGGVVELESAAGVGSTFRIVLPVDGIAALATLAGRSAADASIVSHQQGA